MQNQLDPDYQQLLIPDKVGHGYLHANTQIYLCKKKVAGRFVYVLDDDDFITQTAFIKGLKYILEVRPQTNVFFVKGFIGKKLLPDESHWQNFPVRGYIGSPNFVVRRDLYDEHSYLWQQTRAGDFYFISSVMRDQRANPFWWDEMVFEAPVGECNGEIEIANENYADEYNGQIQVCEL